MWPRLNLEDLCRNEPLLLLLNARGRQPPSTFALADLEPAWFGLKLDIIPVPPFLDQHIMLFSGQGSAETYGELVSWQERPDAFARLLGGHDISPGEGLMVLEIQDRLYQFLANVCTNMLHDLSVENTDELVVLPIQPEPPLPSTTTNDSGTGTSLLAIRLEREYHVPAKLDVRRLLDLVSSKLSEAEDTLWALREDAGFFSTALLEEHRTRPEYILDTNNAIHEVLGLEGGRDAVIMLALSDLWLWYVPIVEIWGGVYDRVAQLAELKEKLFDSPEKQINPGDDLPAELSMAFYNAWRQLDLMACFGSNRVREKAYKSPAIRSMFRRKAWVNNRLAMRSDHYPPPLENEKGPDSYVKVSSERDDYKNIVDRAKDTETYLKFGLHNFIEDMEQMAVHPSHRELICPTVASSLSDVAVASECIRQIQLFQPWAATFEPDMRSKDTARKIKEGWNEINSDLAKYEYLLSLSSRGLALKVAVAKYPIEKRPNRANVEAIRAAEKALDDFWDLALWELRSNDILSPRVEKVLGRSTPERTAPWVEPPPSTDDDAEAVDDSTDVTTSFSSLTVGDQESCHRPRPATLRAKIKTHGLARPPPAADRAPVVDEDDEPDDTSAADAGRESKLGVDKRSLAVFELLFHRSWRGSQPGEVPWTDFTHAMHRVGFGVEKLGGSSWHFTPGPALASRGAPYTRGIHFHEPHPVSKIHFTTARQMGKRLGRTYGWCMEMFVREGGMS